MPSEGRGQPAEGVGGEAVEGSGAHEGPCQECAVAKRQRPSETKSSEATCCRICLSTQTLGRI